MACAVCGHTWAAVGIVEQAFDHELSRVAY